MLTEVFIAKPLHVLSSKLSNFLFETVIGRQLPLYFRHQAFIAFCTKIRHRTPLELDLKPAQLEMPDWALDKTCPMIISVQTFFKGRACILLYSSLILGFNWKKLCSRKISRVQWIEFLKKSLQFFGPGLQEIKRSRSRAQGGTRYPPATWYYSLGTPNLYCVINGQPLKIF